MSLEEIFLKNLEEWNRHIEGNMFMSDVESYIDCKAFDAIVSLGRKALPLIYKNLDRVDKSHLSCLLEAILCDKFSIPDEIKGRIENMYWYSVGALSVYVNK